MDVSSQTTTYDLDPIDSDIPQVKRELSNGRGAQATKRAVARDTALSATRNVTGREVVGGVWTQVAETINNTNHFHF
uniref:p8 n=1 Tax=Japanese iris necrotic ring virus TaxID=77344 RepID=I3XIG9_9TOMB|nr:P8 [Japanese iris necrotic ring virus]